MGNDQILTRSVSIRRVMRAGAVIVFVLSLAYLSLSTLILNNSLAVQRKIPLKTPLDMGLLAERLHFESLADRVPLKGWFLNSWGDRAIILVHGIDSHGWDGSQVEITQAYLKAGFNVLVFDLRGHGRSGGKQLGLGWQERGDLKSAVNLLIRRGFEPGLIGVHGTSYGAATALLTAAITPEIGAVVADSSFADVRDIMDTEIANRARVPVWLIKLFLRPGLELMAWLVYNLELDVIAPVQAVSQIAPRQILFIHGQEDKTIPVTHAYWLKDRSNSITDELWVLVGLGHTEGVKKANPIDGTLIISPMRGRFLQKVSAFFDQALR